jgi:hypothetical protein
VLDRVRKKTCKQIEKLVAEVAPRPDVPGSVRKLPSSRQVAGAATGAQGSLEMSAGG